MNLKKDLKDITRASHILEICLKNGLGFLVEEAELKWHLPFHKKLGKQKFKKPLVPEVKLRQTFEELGTTYIKLGQLLSIRPDLIPERFCVELRKLQDHVKPFSYLEVKKVVEAELKNPINKVFKSFEIVPLAAASIGQVHKAVLKDGKTVAVKVQRPGVDKLIETDIEIMYYFAHHYDKRHKDSTFSAVRIVDEFQDYTQKELNYLTEAKNATMFAENFAKEKNIIIPDVFWDYTTKKILTMEYIEGESLSQIIKSKKSKKNKKIVDTFCNAVMKMLYVDGFFHADLHPGNIFVLKGNKLAFLDFGIVGSINENMRRRIVDMLVAMVLKDIERISYLMTKIGERTDKTNIEQYEREVENIIITWHGTSLKQIKISQMLHLLFNASIDNHIILPQFLVLYGKAFVTLEATGQLLYPEFNAVEYVEPYVKKVLKQRYSPKNVFKEFIDKTRRSAELIQEIPDDARVIMDKLKSGTFKIDIEDTQIKQLGLDVDTSSNRLAFGFVAAAFIISSALIFGTNLGPKYLGYPIISMFLFLVGIVFLILLFSSILREERR
ncbi:MAG: AarF/ABC1/UbiB kinase family protein [Candidatus Woesearchaeota archaeon]|nr:AarF/ABC1/UbiB kinase family protein [Candidatus Woesearchaeota archaeon]MDP7458538.1 AarF/ABC1/UbiB kinase family protein [Candidatus Woesearchaeota archaeon]